MGLIVTDDYVENVLQPQGIAVTVENVATAEEVIALKLGILLDEEFDVDLWDRNDKHWVRRAVIYEAAWLKSHPDLLIRINAELMITDDDSVHIEDDGLLLAPLARWALLRTSVFRARSAQLDSATAALRSQFRPIDPFAGRYDNAGYYPWR